MKIKILSRLLFSSRKNNLELNQTTSKFSIDCSPSVLNLCFGMIVVILFLARYNEWKRISDHNDNDGWSPFLRGCQSMSGSGRNSLSAFPSVTFLIDLGPGVKKPRTRTAKWRDSCFSRRSRLSPASKARDLHVGRDLLLRDIIKARRRLADLLGVWWVGRLVWVRGKKKMHLWNKCVFWQPLPPQNDTHTCGGDWTLASQPFETLTYRKPERRKRDSTFWTRPRAIIKFIDWKS